ncbi:MAG: ABC transporter permease [Candidatus Omnitrophota bacterium]
MKTYIIRRIIIAVPLLLVMSFVTFLFIHLAPGNYFDSLRLNPQISEETILKYQAAFHLDKPVIVQYLYWLKGIFRLDLGYSFFYNCPVSKVIFSRAFNTIILALASLALTWLLAIPLGIYAALKHNRIIDRLFSVLSLFGLSMPGFFLGLIGLYLANVSGLLPLGGMRSTNFDSLSGINKAFDILRHLILPASVIAISGIGSLQRIMRANVLEVLRQQYILCARAKGLPENKVIYKHALRNAINPLITIFGYQLSDLLSGAALIEIVCNWPGLGMVMLTAVRAQDLFLVMAGMLISGVLLLFGNLTSDILLAWSDPRIRYA